MDEDKVSVSGSQQSPGVDNVTAQKEKESMKDMFHVDTSRIQTASLAENSELQGLGLNVFNQDEFEQEVMAQVDEAMALKERERLQRIVQKELKTVNEEIASTKQELGHIAKVISQVPKQTGMNSKETARKMETVNRHKENKLKQLKKLLAKKKSLSVKSGQSDEADDDTTSLETALGIEGVTSKETEMERMIRTGEMTPFGTVVNTTAPPAPETPQQTPKPSTSAQMSDFEQFLLGQEKKNVNKNKLVKSSSVTAPTKTEKVRKKSLSYDETSLHRKHPAGESDKKSRKKLKSSSGMKDLKSDKDANFFDEKDKRKYRPSEKDFSNYKTSKRKSFSNLSHNFSEDGDLSDFENGDNYDEDYANEDSDEYIPDVDELRDSWKDDEMDASKTKEEEEDELIRKRIQANLNKGFKGKKSMKRGGEDSSDDDSASLNKIKGKHQRKKQKNQDVHARDDGNIKLYKSRIKKWKMERLMKKKERIDGGEEMSDSESDEEFDGGLKVPGRIWNKLHGYQKTCVRWLWELHGQEAGGIVGDEMGLGKTIQMISFLTSLRYSELRYKKSSFVGLGPVLIVCPTTVMHQWVKEFHKWWPEFRVAILHSSGSHTGKEEHLVNQICSSNGVLITSFTTVTIQQDLLLQNEWHYVILDEGHKIRNPDAQVTLVCKQFRTPHRIILSGSPIQNNLKELWSLFDFIFPGKLGTLPDFMAHFSVPIVQGGYANASQTQVQAAYKCACVLRDTINPYLLRRMKADVKDNINLPTKNEQVLFCRLSEHQADVYQEYLDSKECNMILSGNFMVFPGLITLRKICNHPDLSTGGPKVFTHEDTSADKSLEYGYPGRSGKMIVVQSLLKLWKTQGHRVLLFTQSKQMLDILETFVQNEGYNFLRMDGGTSISGRQPLITKFNNDPSHFVFLLTTRVGGLGVNLTGANRIIIFDPDWNPSTDMQARERAWRIGQTRDVTIYRLLTTGTIEEKIYHRQIFKQFLTNRVLKDPKQRRFFKSNDLFELFQLNLPDRKQSTETSAIFAGTGCDIAVKPVLKKYNGHKATELTPKNRHDSQPKKKNLFDEMKERNTIVEKEDSDEEDSLKAMIGEEKVNKMKELARKLSQQIANKRSKNSETMNGTSGSQSQTINGRTNQDCDSSTTAAASLISKINSESIQSVSKSSEKSHKESHKSKKRKKGAKFEGTRIANLHKQAEYKYPAETETQNSAREDDYVLAKLFKKTGVHSAMQHDKIMQSSHSDYAIVEAEAERVASEAVRALKQSRSQCYRATSGVPTWTGHHGGTKQGGASRPRFGQKKNSRLLPLPASQKPSSSAVSSSPSSSSPASTSSASTSSASASATSATPKKNGAKSSGSHFDGSLSGNVHLSESTSTSNSNQPMSSSELINLIRTRNYVKGDGNEATTSSSVNAAASSIEDSELLTDIRNYIAFGCAVDGEARTQELLDQFKGRLPVDQTAKFKAMLQQICNFDKYSGVGVWRLKPEFR